MTSNSLSTAPPSDVLTLTPTEHVEVVDVSASALTVLVTYRPGGTPPPPHFHPQQDERFEVLAGELHATVEGTARVLGPGAVLDLPRGTTHAFHNPGEEDVRARWTTTPAGRTLEWVRALDAANREAGGAASPTTLLRLLAAHRDVMRLTGPLGVLVRLASLLRRA